MTQQIIIALIAGISAVAGSYFANNTAQAVMEERIREIKSDITTLSTRVDKHNNLIERMVAVEQSTKSAHHRLDAIEHHGG